MLQFDDEEEEDIYIPYQKVAPSTGIKIYDIGGVSIKFPYEAYDSQLSIMREIIAGVQNGEHCLIESPTGTGKTAATLCPTAGWQLQYKNDPQRTGSVPKIYYATRTHTQISQVIEQFKKTEYAFIPITILASREQTCINEEAKLTKDGGKATGDAINKFCQDHRAKARKINKKNPGGPGSPFLTSTCPYYETKDQGDFSGLLEEQKQKDNNKGNVAVDIEDLVAYGQKNNCCPYYGTKSLQPQAEIIFCTYNHILQNVVQKASNIEFENNIFIFDEAHNIESFCQQQGTSEISLNRVDEVKQVLAQAQIDGHDFESEEVAALQTLEVAFTQLSKWLRDQTKNKNFVRDPQRKLWETTRYKLDLNNTNYADFCAHQNDPGQNLHQNGGQRSSSSNSSPISSKRRRNEESFPEMMSKIKFGPDDLTDLQDAVKTMKRMEPSGDHVKLLDDKAVNFISKFLFTLKKLFGRNKDTGVMSDDLPYPRLRDFKILLIKEVKRDKNESMKLSIICLNPAIVFSKMKKARTVIVTSGTLTPLESFSTELGFNFTRTLSAPHVLSMDRIFVTALERLKPQRSSQELIFTYTPLNGPRGPDIRNDLGQVILSICQTVPNGVLVFCTSKTFIETIHTQFADNGTLAKIKAVKTGGVFWETEIDPQKHRMKEVIDKYAEGAKDDKGGAIFFAVMRGRVSEGVDFSNELARAVITVGLPLLPIYDDQVMAKKKYNNERSVFEPCLTGDAWYLSSAYRAINQAFGRCIRHSMDWGVICIVEKRLVGSDPKMSKWVRDGLCHTTTNFDGATNLEQVLPAIESFVQRLNHQPAA